MDQRTFFVQGPSYKEETESGTKPSPPLLGHGNGFDNARGLSQSTLTFNVS